MSHQSTPLHARAVAHRDAEKPAVEGMEGEIVDAVPRRHASRDEHHSMDIMGEPSKNDSSRQNKIDNAPHVVLISEMNSLQGGMSLALHLARHIGNSGQHRALVVDLTPAASRLAEALKANPQLFLGWAELLQPLWISSPHGRTLRPWLPSESSVDLVAQLATEFPTAEQMPRICEQLVRLLGQPRLATDDSRLLPHYHSVFLLSEFVGVPLDSAAWQAADEIWLLHDASMKPAQVQASLSARISPQIQGQRHVLLAKQPPTLRTWASRRRVESIDDISIPVGIGPRVDCFRIAWPQVPNRMARSMASTARELAQQVLQLSNQRSTRQAS